MPWRDAVQPVRMDRVALVGPTDSLRDLLVRVADAGSVELDRVTAPGEAVPGDAARRLQRLGAARSTPARLSPVRPDLDELERDGHIDLIEGEAQSWTTTSSAPSAAARSPPWPGGCRRRRWPDLADDLESAGCSVVRLPRPGGVDPPTLLPEQAAVGRSLSPLVQTYARVPYPERRPDAAREPPAYVLMFGMMFGDVGHGLLLVFIAGIPIISVAGRGGGVGRLTRVAEGLALRSRRRGSPPPCSASCTASASVPPA